MTLILFLVGLALLILGAELLVKGASHIARSLGIAPLVVGLTVVAFGTSAPELAISLSGILSGEVDIAIGNVIGSNIFNVLLILGLSALIVPLTVTRQLIRFDVPVMIAVSVILLLLVLDRSLSRVDGALMVAILILYFAILLMLGLRDGDKNETTGAESDGQSEQSPKFTGWIRDLLYVAIGLAMLVYGSQWLVDSAVIFATWLGVSQLIIGLTIVSAGTSLPEVVTSVIAAIRGERDIAVGNVVGSNILNVLSVLGISAVVAPTPIAVPDAVIGFDLPLMIAVALACLPIFFTGGVIRRWEGGLFLLYFVAYILYLVLNATQHDLLPIFNATMLYFVMPITVVTLATVVFRELLGKSKLKT